MSQIHHIHSSGRFDRPFEALVAALESYVHRGADLITLTEQQKDSHRKALSILSENFNYEIAQGLGHIGDSVIAADRSKWEILHVWSQAATTFEQRRGPGGPPPAHYITALMRQRQSHKRVLVSVLHTPSHVEQDWTAKGIFKGHPYRVMVWLDAHRHWATHLWKLRKHFGVKVIMVADWNVNLKRKLFRALLKSLHPKLSLTWKTFPRSGTHGPRLIDGTLTNCTTKAGAHLITDDDSSDHRPYAELLEL